MRSVKEILDDSRIIAVVGISDKPERDSYRVSQYMQSQGYRIIPVNPLLEEVLGEKAYPSLSDIPEPVDIVNVFRRPEQVPPVVDEAIAIGANAVWLQLGIRHAEAAQKAAEAGLDVVEDKCILIEHRDLR